MSQARQAEPIPFKHRVRYAPPWSTNTRKVLLVLAEKGQEAELSLVLIPKGEQRLAAHVARHPFAKVPVLEDEGFIVYGTSAINRYLEQKFPTPALVPSDPSINADAVERRFDSQTA